jgi:hypothetical protein
MRTFAIICEIFAAKVHKIIETHKKLAPFFRLSSLLFCEKKKEQAKGESRGERSKGRGEMDVGERGE